MYREPTVKGRKPGLKINSLDQKEERNIQPEQNKETRIQKNEERLRNLRDNFKHSHMWIMKENFPNLAKEIDFQEFQEAQSPKQVGPKEEHTKAHRNYITQD